MDKFKIEVKKHEWLDGKKTIIRLPGPNSTNITWEQLVKIIAERGMRIVDKIRLHNKGQKGGTNQLDRAQLFTLWKHVEAHRIAQTKLGSIG